MPLKLRYRKGLAKTETTIRFRFKVGKHPFTGDTGCYDLDDAAIWLANKKKAVKAEVRAAKRGEAPKPIPTVEKMLEEWKRLRGPNLTKKTVDEVERSFKLYILPLLGNRKPEEITPLDIAELKAAFMGRITRRKQPPSLHSLNTMLMHFRTVFNWALAMRIIKVKVGAPQEKAQRRPKTWIHPEQVEPFLAELDRRCKRNAAVCAAARVHLFCGLREEEVLGMAWEHLSGGHYTVPEAKDRDTRTVPVPDEVQAWLDKLPREDGQALVFVDAKGNPHQAGWLKKPIREVAVKVGVGALSSHRLRGSYATLLAKTGAADPTTIQELMGHESFETTWGYIEASGLAHREQASRKLMVALGRGHEKGNTEPGSEDKAS